MNDAVGSDANEPGRPDGAMQPLLISAVVPAYNAEPYLKECLRSILDQRGPFRLEVIVVDDGSDDHTAELAASVPGVRVLRQPNAGPSAARNRGIEAATGQWIALLDSDDRWPPGRLAAQLAVLEQAPDLGLIFGDCAAFDGHGIWMPSFFADARLDAAFWGHPLRVVDAYQKLFRLNYIPTGAVLMRRDVVQQAGGFDADLRMVEDLDLWLRIARCRPIGRTSVVCQHKRRHAGNVSADLPAMTLANLQVLDRHRRRHRAELRRLGVRLGHYFAMEYCLLGDYRERAGDPPGARRWYRRALREYPSARACYYWLRSFRGTARGDGSA